MEKEEKKEKNKVKILVCCHKPDYVKDNDIYTPVQVGKAVSTVNLGFLGDDTGDNISSKNDWFAELTATYWAWKNLKNVDYVGICHYRRYFNFHTRGLLFSEYQIVKTEEIKDKDLSIPDLRRIFTLYDVILPHEKYYPCTLFEDYSHCHNSEEMRILLKVIREKFPDYYESSCNVLKNNKLMHYNIFLMPWHRFEKYCEWLFSVFDALDLEFKALGYCPIQRRVYGFMGERLMTIYAFHQRWKIKHYPLYWVTEQDKNLSFMRRLLRWIKWRIVFNFMHPLATVRSHSRTVF